MPGTSFNPANTQLYQHKLLIRKQLNIIFHQIQISSVPFQFFNDFLKRKNRKKVYEV
jgi:hypothetical protein